MPKGRADVVQTLAYLLTLDKLFVLQLILAQDKYSTLDLMQTQANSFALKLLQIMQDLLLAYIIYGARNKLLVNSQLAYGSLVIAPNNQHSNQV
jgi:hypothetical protein